jgi:hypothetical protein
MDESKTQHKSKFITSLHEWLRSNGDADGVPNSRQDQYAGYIDAFVVHWEANKPERQPFDGVHFNFGKFEGEPIATVAKYNESYCKFLLSKGYVDEAVKAVIRQHMKPIDGA